MWFRISEVYNEFAEALSQVDVDQDLETYSNNFGTGMAFLCPDFEVNNKVTVWLLTTVLLHIGV